MNPILPALLAAAMIALPAAQTAPAWSVVSGDSRVEFIAEQQGARFRGSFERFDADIRIDPQDPQAGSIQATVRVDSVNTRNDERDGYLRGEEWFDVARWPEAHFASQRIRKAADGELVAEGELRLRDRARPVGFHFRLQPGPDTDRLRLTGSMQLKRSDFGVGQGVWENTEWVGDDVTVEVSLLLRPAEPPPAAGDQAPGSSRSPAGTAIAAPPPDR